MTRQNNQIQDKKIILVLDTSWLMDIGKKDHNVLLELLKPPEVEIRIHNRVFKELDGLKNVEGKSLQARRVSQYLEEALNTYKDRVQISDFGIKQPAEKFASALQSEVDAIVLTLAEQKKENDKVIILTTDRNQRVLAENERIKCETPLTKTDVYFVFNEPFDIEKEDFSKYTFYSPANKKSNSELFWTGVILAVVFPFLIPLIAIVWLGIYIYKKSIDNLPPDPADARWKYRMRYANTNFYDETDPYDPTEVIDTFDYPKPFYVSCDDE